MTVTKILVKQVFEAAFGFHR